MDSGRGASRDRKLSIVAFEIVKNCVSIDRATIVRQESTSNSVSIVLLISKGLALVTNNIFVFTCALQKQGIMSDETTFQTI